MPALEIPLIFPYSLLYTLRTYLPLSIWECVYHGEISNDVLMSLLVYSMLFLLVFLRIALFLNVIMHKTMTFFSFCGNILPQMKL